MDHDALLKLLGVSPVQGAKTVDPLQELPDAENWTTDLSETCLVLDDWDWERGERVSAYYDAKMLKLPPDAWADFHGVCYLPSPVLVQGCIDSRRLEFVSTLLNTPEHQTLRASTQLNPMSSELAAVKIGVEFSRLLEQDKKAGKKKGSSAPKDSAKAELRCVGAVMKAVASASKEVEEYEEVCRGLGGDGPDPKDMPLDAVKKVFHRVKSSQTLRRIFDLAGRFRRVAQSKQRQKTLHGYDDMVGITVSRDVGKVLSSELCRLLDPELELDALDRILSKRALAREYVAYEPVGKGPVVVCVDESGSMEGEPVENAKAFALALAWVAQHQKRYCCLIGYAGGSEGNLLVIPPGKSEPEKLVKWLEHFYSGGTTLDVPLRELPAQYWQQINPPKGKVDVVLITDALVKAPPPMVKAFNEWKAREQVKCYGIVLNHGPGVLSQVCEETWTVKSISPDGEAVGVCLSL